MMHQSEGYGGDLDLRMEVERNRYNSYRFPSVDRYNVRYGEQHEKCHHHETEIYKDNDLYLAAKEDRLDDFRRALDRVTSAENTPKDTILSRLSPSRNTFLHIAAKHGSVDIAAYVAAESPSLMLCKNSSGDTALHVAAQAGKESVVKSLADNHRDSVGSSGAGTDNLLRINNEGGNTAVHEALIYDRESIATYLIEQDAEVTHWMNNDEESVLYLAAKAGFASCVSLILRSATDQQNLLRLMNGRSPIREAVQMKNRDVLEAMLNRIPSTVQLRDGKWRTPLHYAALYGDLEDVRFLLENHALTTNQNDKECYFPIHLASVRGHVDVISLLLQGFPEPVDLLDSIGRNILHLAAQYGRCNVVTYILKNPDLRELINMKDENGNTPLHLATMNWHPKVVSELIWDERVNVKLVNRRWMTALDVAEEGVCYNPPFRQRLTWAALRAAGVPRSLNGTPCWKKSGSLNNYRDRVSILLLVSTLIATVTFAAGFTMPGGHNSSGTEMGTPTMLREKGFQIFVFCDAIALYSSIVVAVALIWAQLGDTTLLLHALNLAQPLMGFALAMMSVAFTAGVFLAVSKLRWLSITILVMAITFLAVLLVLGLPLWLPFTSRNWLWRYICYYPFYLLIVATSNESKDEFE